MSYFGNIKVTDKAGWSRVFALEKAITLIGNDPVNDIILPAGAETTTAPVSLQLICEAESPTRIKAINLRHNIIPRFNLNSLRSNPIMPQQSSDLVEGDQLTLGSYQLVFSLIGQGFRLAERSEHLGVELLLPTLDLSPEWPLEGEIRLTNFSQQVHLQLDVDIEGLPRECYRIDPAPLLHAGGSEMLTVRFIHRGSQPPMGVCQVKLRAAAPHAFVLETVTIPFALNVKPLAAFQASFGELGAIPEPHLELIPQRPRVYTLPVTEKSTAPATTAPESYVEPADQESVGRVVREVMSELPPQESQGRPPEGDWQASAPPRPSRKASKPTADLKNVRVLREDPDLAAVVDKNPESEETL
jgi:hypothetical protein